MLVIMEYRDITAFLQLAFNFKAARSRNILQIDTAKGACKQSNGIDKFIHILGTDTERECIHITEFLKQGTFAFHNRHTCLRADIPQTQYSRTIGNHCHQIMPTGVHIAQIHIVLNFQARLCDAWCIGNRQCICILYLAAGNDFDFALPVAVGL